MTFCKNTIFLLPILLFGCWSVFQNQESGKKYDNMVLIKASGKTFLMGSVDSLANANEGPVMPVTFSYDFWMGESEVTQAQYVKMTGKNPSFQFPNQNHAPQHPVNNVSWYDAVLFCNAMSKHLKLDTVYEYTFFQASETGSVYEIQGLSIHYDREGCRLPTEAEWEFAARAGNSASFYWGSLEDSTEARHYAWFSSNASGMSHPVKSLKPNLFGLYDTYGNVLEWTNDWKGTYTRQPIVDFLGSLSASSKSERVVKGGAFNQDISMLRPSARNLTYATISSVTGEFLGFRYVIGGIPNGSYTTHGGLVTNDVPPITQLASKTDIRNIFQTNNVKICFVNVAGSFRNLCFIQYSKQSYTLEQIHDSIPVYHPVFSPDGNFIAYCTRNEGLSSPSKIAIVNLTIANYPQVFLPVEQAYIPRWWVDETKADTFLIYTNSAVDNKNIGRWGQSVTYKQKIKGGLPIGEPVSLTVNGSYHDGMSTNGRYLATGYSQLKIYDFMTNSSSTLFSSPQNGKDSLGSTQVCNVSLSPDLENPNLLFLDFGYPRISDIIGASYGVHEYLFLSDIAGNVNQVIKAPGKGNTWEHAEWSNHPNFAISGAAIQNGNIQSLYAINTSASSYIKLFEGTRLWHPALWIGKPNHVNISHNLSIDSLGHYNDPPTNISQMEMACKMAIFWKNFNNNPDGIIVGSSRSNGGLNPHLFQNHKVINLSITGLDLAGSSTIVKNYILPHLKSTKFIITSLMPAWLSYPKEHFQWENFYTSSKGYKYDLKNNFWKDGLPDGLLTAIQSVSYPKLNSDSIGYMPHPIGKWGKARAHVNSVDFTVNDKIFIENMTILKQLVNLLEMRKIHLLVINFPQNPGFSELQTYGLYGPEKKSVVRDIICIYQEMERQSKYFHFYDANLFGLHDFTDEEAQNQDHLSFKGAAKLTPRIDSLINTFTGL